jgi:hypothetical protein
MMFQEPTPRGYVGPVPPLTAADVLFPVEAVAVFTSPPPAPGDGLVDAAGDDEFAWAQGRELAFALPEVPAQLSMADAVRAGLFFDPALPVAKEESTWVPSSNGSVLTADMVHAGLFVDPAADPADLVAPSFDFDVPDSVLVPFVPPADDPEARPMPTRSGGVVLAFSSRPAGGIQLAGEPSADGGRRAARRARYGRRLDR